MFYFSRFAFFYRETFPVQKNKWKEKISKSKVSLNDDYRVYKIDSINNWYLIYAKKQGVHFKIISKKEGQGYPCNKVEIDKSYEFNLKSIWYKTVTIKGRTISLEELPHLSGIGLDRYTTVSLERDSINDLYEVNNVRGLCFFNNY